MFNESDDQKSDEKTNNEYCYHCKIDLLDPKLIINKDEGVSFFLKYDCKYCEKESLLCSLCRERLNEIVKHMNDFVFKCNFCNVIQETNKMKVIHLEEINLKLKRE